MSPLRGDEEAVADSTGAQVPSPVPHGGRGQAVRRWAGRLAVLLVLLLGASVTGLLPIQIMRVGSESMSPTIGTGDLVLVRHQSGPVARMSVVAVERPDTGTLLVKRAVAVGGDRFAIEDGVLVVNGTPVCEPSIDPARLDGVWIGPVTVPDGELFLLGDEREASVDSRVFGTVPDGNVRGVVVGRIWPSPGGLPEDRC